MPNVGTPLLATLWLCGALAALPGRSAQAQAAPAEALVCGPDADDAPSHGAPPAGASTCQMPAAGAPPWLSSAFDPEAPVGVGAGGPPALPDAVAHPTAESAPESAPEPPAVFAPPQVQEAPIAAPQLIGSRLVLHLMRPARNGQMMVVALYSALDCNGPMLLHWQNKTRQSFAVRDGWSHALLPIGVGTQPGRYPLRVRCGAHEAAFGVSVLAATYPESRLQVAAHFSASPPSRVLGEQQSIGAALHGGRRARLWHLPFVFPTAGITTSPYGVRRTFNGKLKSRHLGTDFRGKLGDPVWATNDGVVALAAKDYYFTGNAVFIDHGEDLFSMYFHLSEVHVHTGDPVSRGQFIGAVGGSGRATGPHMHFGVKLDGTYVDPADLLGYDPLVPLGPPY